MQLSQTLRRTTTHLRGALAFVAIATLATACSDTTVAPAKPRALSTAQPVLARNDGGGKFTYDPDRGMTVKLGNNDHYIVIPAGAVCDVGKSKYGRGLWDSWCRPEDRRVEISFKTWTDRRGHPFVEFQPALRFVPGKEVLLYFADARASMNDYSEILYCPDNKALACYDESLTDRSLKTVRDRRGNIYRRIKHFSGYNVAAGIECDLESGDPDCIDLGDSRSLFSGMNHTISFERKKRSGYMVVSGLEDSTAKDDKDRLRDDKDDK